MVGIFGLAPGMMREVAIGVFFCPRDHQRGRWEIANRLPNSAECIRSYTLGGAMGESAPPPVLHSIARREGAGTVVAQWDFDWRQGWWSMRKALHHLVRLNA